MMSQLYIPLPDALEGEPRYTTVALVKAAAGIDSSKYDDQVKAAIVTMEYLIDSHLNTSFPQSVDPNAGTDEALDPPPIEGIPESVKYAAQVGAIKTLALTQQPGGGSDDFIGAVDFSNQSRLAFNAVQPLLLNLQRAWGLS